MKKLLLSLSLFFSISNASALTISHVGEQFLGHGVSDLTFEVSAHSRINAPGNPKLMHQ